jgi:hypothetical protein
VKFNADDPPTATFYSGSNGLVRSGADENVAAALQSKPKTY